ncbi:hypothetical protein BDQ17DRAFT_1335377 [Cyathus striatus]|nr:hypothetical protein BDQ17DRAFT_1335377 [Cyathus striatus]
MLDVPWCGGACGKVVGGNLSLWEHYGGLVAGMLDFAEVFQVPMVGSDICGFGGNMTEMLCANQEFYHWPTTTAAAKNGLDMCYRLLDYIYMAFDKSHTDGSTSMSMYLPKHTFYNFKILKEVRGKEASMRLYNISFSEIPVFVRGGVVLSLWVEVGLTKKEVRRRDFEVLVAPGSDGRASGSLNVDDRESIEVSASTVVEFNFLKGGKLDVVEGVVGTLV